MKIISKIFLFVLISSNLFGIEKVAYIQSIKGDVRIYSKNKLKPPIVAIIGRAIQENDIIRTYDNSECVIISKDKTTFLHLNETTEVQFIESSLSRTLNSVIIVLLLVLFILVLYSLYMLYPFFTIKSIIIY